MKQELLAQGKNQEVKNWITMIYDSRVKKNLSVDQSEFEHIIDFLNSPQAPQRLMKMSYQTAVEQSKKWVESLKKKARGIVETEQDTKVILRSKKTGMKFVQLIGENAFKREGLEMGHCVATYYNKAGTKVYSLRDINNNPHCTIEVVGDSNVQQIKGKGNGSIHPRYINYIIKILTKFFKLPVRDSELENLGYIMFSEQTMLFLENNSEDLKFLTYGGKKYLYTNSLK